MSGKTVSSPLIILLFGFASTFADPVLLTGWQWEDPAGSNHEFRVFSFVRQSWETSNAQLAEGWHLATITGAEEQQALISGLDGLTGEFWLGGRQSGCQTGPEDDWAWVTGEEWSYKNWAPGEPNDAYGSSSEEHIAVWSNWGTSQWLWNDEGSLPNISGYVTERTASSVPEPAQLPLLASGLVIIACLIRRKKRPRNTETPYNK